MLILGFLVCLASPAAADNAGAEKVAAESAATQQLRSQISYEDWQRYQAKRAQGQELEDWIKVQNQESQSLFVAELVLAGVTALGVAFSATIENPEGWQGYTLAMITGPALGALLVVDFLDIGSVKLNVRLPSESGSRGGSSPTAGSHFGLGAQWQW